MSDSVILKTETLDNLIASTGKYELTIPDYQRIYCWEEKQVFRLLEDIQHHADKTYHMGSIILHKRITNNKTHYDIVDGQQRLVTLSLLLSELGCKTPFLNEKFESELARNYIAYNKWLITNFIQRQKSFRNTESILNNLTFSVLILESANLDLAYTFFTTANGKGKPLSDFDLLKSHHLRYILIQKQAEHVAGRWDNLVLESDNNDNSKALGRTFDIYLFRLRKWMRKRSWDDNEKRKVKNEFEAAPIIPDIPPFGEQFHFYESIQGGAHFFSYAEHFIHRFKEFEQTKPYQLLNNHLQWEKHWWYRDCIEALLFAYYLKFGMLYLNDACLFISRYVSQHRFENSRAYLHSIHEYVSDSEIVMMIDQATSPTFFLGELEGMIKKLPFNQDELDGTRKRYNQYIKTINEELIDSITITSNYYEWTGK
jgi:hypothetical protein